ncbi:GAP family protein [Agrococcus terreus]|uniref:Sap, sulfolipid-1-addressing protein n=1 Tax=Agrococcus terreus TaxID=574649 RepID=A0ABQ2KPJ2_9MICO|nr:GAP family protein [Agrococcus terreus]GGN89492.1 hypothetical protein GCM10010968_26230 [Agrococcus terreus]
MDLPTIGMLALLALADSTSFGTLLIPVWLLLASSRPRPGRMLVYLGTVAGSYLVLGALLSLGARLLLDDLRAWIASPVGGGVLVVVGIVLLVGAIVSGGGGGDGAPSGRLVRWRERAVGSEAGSLRPLMALAVAATLLEIATLLPYLVAIGILDAAELPVPLHGAALVGYCLVMVLPALALLVVRLVAHRAVEPLLQRVNAWLTKQAGELTAWIAGLVGVLLINLGSGPIGGIGGLVDAVTDGVGSLFRLG